MIDIGCSCNFFFFLVTKNNYRTNPQLEKNYIAAINNLHIKFHPSTVLLSRAS